MRPAGAVVVVLVGGLHANNLIRYYEFDCNTLDWVSYVIKSSCVTSRCLSPISFIVKIIDLRKTTNNITKDRVSF